MFPIHRVHADMRAWEQHHIICLYHTDLIEKRTEYAYTIYIFIYYGYIGTIVWWLHISNIDLLAKMASFREVFKAIGSSVAHSS